MAVMMTVRQLSEECRMDRNRFYEWARREDDPLPLRTIDGTQRSSVIAVDDWMDWYMRNSKQFKEAKDD